MGIFSIAIIISNVLITWKGLKDSFFMSKYEFNVERVLLMKEYYRMVTKGFLHVNWWHLGFNMLTIFLFGEALEAYLGIQLYALIYFGSLVGGSAVALLIRKNDGGYSSVGASGAVLGVVFAGIALFPGMKLGLFFIPIGIPAWIYGLAFVAYSIYGIRSRKDNVGHEAHLGGAVIGMLLAILIFPKVLAVNWLPILVVMVPALGFLTLLILRPHALITGRFFGRQRINHTIDQRYNAERLDKQKEIDRILDKIHRKGIKSLTPKEKEMLDRYSKSV